MVDLLVLGLATWRTSNLITNERGPFDMFEWLRSQAGIQHHEHEPVEWSDDGLQLLLMCPYCNSVWIAVFYTLVLKIFPVPVMMVAVSGLAIVLHEVSEWLGRKP